MKNEINEISQKSTSILNPIYVMKKIVINKETIKQFIIDEENRRMIRIGKVKSLLEGINKGIHFNSPFVVNEHHNKYHLIDGNHRNEAIRLKLGLDKNFEISVWCAIYRDLTKDKEREIFKLWNIGTSESATDFLKLYFKTITYGAEMLKVLPVSIYGNGTTLGIKLIVGSHIVAKRQKKFRGGYGAGGEQTIADFQDIDKTDILIIKQFCNFMESVFGKYDKKSNRLFYGSTPIPVFYRIWFDNYRIIDDKKLKKAFTKVFVSSPMAWRDICGSGGRNAQMIFYSQSIDALKRAYKKLNIQADVDILKDISDEDEEIIDEEE